MRAKELEEEKIKVGLLSREELTRAARGGELISVMLEEWMAYMVGLGRTEFYASYRCRRVELAAEGCGWRTLRDMSRARAERWLAGLGCSAAVWNMAAGALVGFGKWLVRKEMLVENVFYGLAHKKKLPVWRRRVITAEEFGGLVEAARGMGVAGRERAVAYMVAVGTGLRWSEICSLRVGDFREKDRRAVLVVDPANEKARRGAVVVVPRGIAEELRGLARERKIESLDGQALLFTMLKRKGVPDFDRDLKRAGVKKVDENGEKLDIHGLRHAFATRLARSGATAKVAQDMMRHTTLAMTLGIYTHASEEEKVRAADAAYDGYYNSNRETGSKEDTA